MIRPDTPEQFLYSLKGVSSLSRLVPDGSVVSIEIIGKEPSGGTQVRIAGKIITAQGIPGLNPGDILKVRVSFSGTTIFLHPLNFKKETTISNFSGRLGLPETEVSEYLISFFQNIHARLDQRFLNPLIRLTARFPGKEKHAAEAAAILSERGIEPSFESVSHLLDAIEGRSNTESSDENGFSERDFLSFINHKKGQERHWIIIPFKRVIEGCACSGSIRFLIDTRNLSHIETRITYIENAHTWDFSISDGVCQFTANPPFKSVIFEKFVIYLKDILLKSGITGVTYYLPGVKTQSLIKPVDLEI